MIIYKILIKYNYLHSITKISDMKKIDHGQKIHKLEDHRHFDILIYKMLTIHIGTPPTSFNWQTYDKKKNFMSFENLTPKSLTAKLFVEDTNVKTK